MLGEKHMQNLLLKCSVMFSLFKKRFFATAFYLINKTTNKTQRSHAALKQRGLLLQGRWVDRRVPREHQEYKATMIPRSSTAAGKQHLFSYFANLRAMPPHHF